jgi:hypothetical protein
MSLVTSPGAGACSADPPGRYVAALLASLDRKLDPRTFPTAISVDDVHKTAEKESKPDCR